MLEKYEPVCYELLRPAQVKTIREKCPIVYVPFGSLEWHSFHLPLGTDSLKAHGICCEAALKYGGLVLPPVYQGLVGDTNWGPKDWVGYTLGMNQDKTLEDTMLAIAKALVQAGWKVIAGVTGHDVPQQSEAMKRAIDAATKDKGATGFARWEGAGVKKTDDMPYSMDHAATWETSIMMYMYPDKVHLSELTSRGLSTQEDLGMGGPEGIGGHNPVKHSSAELGITIAERCGEVIGAKAKAALEGLGKS